VPTKIATLHAYVQVQQLVVSISLPFHSVSLSYSNIQTIGTRVYSQNRGEFFPYTGHWSASTQGNGPGNQQQAGDWHNKGKSRLNSWRVSSLSIKKFKGPAG